MERPHAAWETPGTLFLLFLMTWVVVEMFLPFMPTAVHAQDPTPIPAPPWVDVVADGEGGAGGQVVGPNEPSWSGAAITLTPGNLRTVGDYRCATWESGSPQTVRLFNVELLLYGVCLKVDTTNSAAEVELHLDPDSDFTELAALSTATSSAFSQVIWELTSGTDLYEDQPYVYGETRSGSTNSNVSTSFILKETAAASTRLTPVNTSAVSATSPARTYRKSDGNNSTLNYCTEKGYYDYYDTNTNANYNRYTNRDFYCRTTLSAVTDGTATRLKLYTALSTSSPNYEADGTTVKPPANLDVTRDAITRANPTLTWTLYGPVSSYQVERQENIALGDTTEWGNKRTFTVYGTRAGKDEWTDTGAKSEKTYQYRIRASSASKWSEWSDYALSPGPRGISISAPGNVALTRNAQNTAVTVSWTSPYEGHDGYALQRRVLVDADGNSFFGNVINLHPDAFLPVSDLSYSDASILPEGTYEYRVAAVLDGTVGDYSAWARTSPRMAEFGEPPKDLRLRGGGEYRYGTREVWLEWDDVPGAQEYEVFSESFSLSGRAGSATNTVSTASIFLTLRESSNFLVRGVRRDTANCGPSPCYTAWSIPLSVAYSSEDAGVPPAAVLPPMATPSANAASVREGLEAVVIAIEEPTGLDANEDILINLAALVLSSGLGLVCYGVGVKARRPGIGIGGGAALGLLTMFLCIRTAEVPEAWGIAVLLILSLSAVLAVILHLRRAAA